MEDAVDCLCVCATLILCGKFVVTFKFNHEIEIGKECVIERERDG